jgi:hypothetical protein
VSVAPPHGSVTEDSLFRRRSLAAGPNTRPRPRRSAIDALQGDGSPDSMENPVLLPVVPVPAVDQPATSVGRRTIFRVRMFWRESGKEVALQRRLAVMRGNEIEQGF